MMAAIVTMGAMDLFMVVTCHSQMALLRPDVAEVLFFRNAVNQPDNAMGAMLALAGKAVQKRIFHYGMVGNCAEWSLK